MSTICGCTISEKEYFVAPSREINGKIIIDRDSALLIGRHNSMIVLNNSVYIHDPWGGHFFTKYDINNDTVYRFCRNGQGPREATSASPVMTLVMKENRNYISVFDSFSCKFLLFEEDHINDYINAQEEFLKDNSIIFTAFQLNDSIVLAEGVFEKNICMFYKNGIKQKSYLESFTKIGNDDMKRIMKDANVFGLSPNKEFFVRITQNGGLIEAYKIENMQLNQLFSHNYFDVICDRNLSFTNDSRYGYIDMSVSNNKIYGLYDGGLVNRENSFRSNIIHIYDMNGQLLEKLLLNHFVECIGVNNEETQLYAISEEHDLLLFNF